MLAAGASAWARKLDDPVFGIGGRFNGVKRRKALRVMFFRLRGLESYGEFFSARGRPVTAFVWNVFCICAAFFFFNQTSAVRKRICALVNSGKIVRGHSSAVS